MKYSNTKSVAHNKAVVGREIFTKVVPETSRPRQLENADRQEVLNFLKIRPVHTVVMTSFIQDNGLKNADNRGVFYGYRNPAGMLEGIALIGHTTLVEARSDDSLMAFALIARRSETPIHFMMSDGAVIETFWKHFTGDNRAPRLACSELLFELNFPFFVRECNWNVRLAETSELQRIAEAHDAVAFIESGSSPMAKDQSGFLKRCLKRIEQRRTFVVFENGKLIFKAEIAAETSDVIYLKESMSGPNTAGRASVRVALPVSVCD